MQLTWMDARVGDRVVTPRIGKPVEVQALWFNALRIASAMRSGETTDDQSARRVLPDWTLVADTFRRRFLNPETGGLHDVIDVDHQPGTFDPTFRPNQIFAVGGLPYPLIDGDPARRVVDEVESRLLTPLGLRSLARHEPGYAPRYQGGVAERDGVYHQGTVWPWLLGPFVEAWVRVRGGSQAAIVEARRRFLLPLTDHLGTAGIGHVSEIADADTPHAPRGCPFQAWSVGELLRLSGMVLVDAPVVTGPKASSIVSVPGRAGAESRKRSGASVRA